MKINFAQVTPADVDTFGEQGLFGPDTSGNYYYNYVEFGTNPGGTEEVAIGDGCDRSIPLTIDSIPELIVALGECYKIAKVLESSQRIQDYVSTDTQAYVTDDTTNYESISNAASWPFQY